MSYTSTYSKLVRYRLTLSVCLLIIVGYTDYVTSYEIGFSPFYFVPISMVAWNGRIGPLLLMTLGCTCVWGLVDVETGHPYSTSFVFFAELGHPFLFFPDGGRPGVSVSVANAGAGGVECGIAACERE